MFKAMKSLVCRGDVPRVREVSPNSPPPTMVVVVWGVGGPGSAGPAQSSITYHSVLGKSRVARSGSAVAAVGVPILLGPHVAVRWQPPPFAVYGVTSIVKIESC